MSSSDGENPERAEDVTFFIDSRRGTIVRTVQGARPIAGDGSAVEAATRSAASTWGLPDFVFRPQLKQKGAGVRELGDGLLVVENVAAVLQVKSRSGGQDDAEKAGRWTDKHVRKAVSQANGTIRELRATPSDFVNERDRVVEIAGAGLDWLIVVIVDHPTAGGHVPAVPERAVAPVVVLTRGDWEFLFDQLKSTRAVLDYVKRVANQRIGLGEEASRYYDLALADEGATPDAIDPRLVPERALRVASPILPVLSAAHEDPRGHEVLRGVVEDIATSPQLNYLRLLEVLAALDSFPVAHRAAMGRFMLDALEHVSGVAQGSRGWRLRHSVGGRREIQLAFGACSKHDDLTMVGFENWVMLRHTEIREITGRDDQMTVGVLITPRSDGVRPWDTTMMASRGDLGLDPTHIADIRAVWGDRDSAAQRPAGLDGLL